MAARINNTRCASAEKHLPHLHLLMQHTIYFGLKKLITAQELPADYTKANLSDKVRIIPQASEQATKEAIELVGNGTVSTAILLHPEPNSILEIIKAHFQFVQAAGGLVLNSENKILLIYRNGKWDLPKGKLDPGEDLPTCAVREVQEETGLKTVSISQPVGATYHTYFQDGKICLKESNWYLMRTSQTDNLVPQAEEGIEQCIWADPAHLAPYMRQTHPSIADILREGLAALK
jgi:8-oxo-dGTP pyrophosphatase MutT (NUDIX family)